MKTLIFNAHVISPDVDLKKASVVIEKGKIRLVTTAAVPKKDFDTVVDARGKYLVPGFIDMHLHGACGYDVCDATPEAIETIASAKLDQTGVGKLMKMAVTDGKATRPKIHCGICGEHGGDPTSVEFCHKIGLNYVSCSPFRVPIARLAAAQAALRG